MFTELGTFFLLDIGLEVDGVGLDASENSQIALRTLPLILLMTVETADVLTLKVVVI